MKFASIVLLFLATCFFVHKNELFAQDKRTQLSPFLSKGYINVNIGYIDYPFTNAQLLDGFKAEKIKIPHTGFRIIIGSQFNKYLSIQYSVTRGILYPLYYMYDRDGNMQHYNVWVNIWGLTFKGHIPINEKSFFFLESGVGLFARNGFTAHNTAQLPNANYTTLLCGGGFQYSINKTWDCSVNTTFSPENKKANQPYTFLFSLGGIWHMRPLSDDKVKANANSTAIFPKQFMQIGFSSNIAGFHANNLFSISPHFIGIPIFYRGAVQIQKGVAINYQHNVFHTKKGFSLDWGTSLSMWKTEKNHDHFIVASIFPVLRFWWLRCSLADFYAVYSILGPSYINKTFFDDRDMGKNLTYQDFMGAGAFIGKTRKLNAELKIQHFSNGNNFAVNPGTDVPLMLNIGYTF